MHLYVAGPMTGIKAFNFPAFLEADEILHAAGHTTFNPARHELDSGIVGDEIFEMSGSIDDLAHMSFSKSDALRRDMNAIADADGIVLIDDWERSSGARLELRAALWASKMVFEIQGDSLVDITHELAEGYS